MTPVEFRDLFQCRPYMRPSVESHTYLNWSDFIAQIGTSDPDYNFVYRWDLYVCDTDTDLHRQINDFTDREEGVPVDFDGKYKYRLEIVFIFQRKGTLFNAFVPKITNEELPAVKEYLQRQWDNMKNYWIPFSNKA